MRSGGNCKSVVNQQYETVRLVHNFHVDFNKLALLEPALRPYLLILNNRVVCPFTRQPLLILLAKAIMTHLFSLKWHCPPGNLCPRIPSRVNYLLWVWLQMQEGEDGGKTEKILDVGTGATLIYPLIGWALFRWKFLAIDVNPNSCLAAQALVKENKLQEAVEVRLSQPDEDQSILHPVVSVDEEIAVVVCNPPFFEEEADSLSVMQGQEHHIEGGQYAFFFALYKDSFRYPRVRLFTCLLGRAIDFHQAKAFLIQEHADGFLTRVRFGEIEQGRSRRFIVLWATKLHD